MYLRLNPKPCLVSVSLLLALLVLGVPDVARGGAPDLGDAVESDPGQEFRDNDCHWMPQGDHDSAQSRPAEGTWEADSASATVGILASAACARAGVCVEQLIEPFAMVGPYIENSLDAVKQFQAWWDAAGRTEKEDETSASDLIEFDFFRVEIGLDRSVEVAVMEPINTQAFGRSVLVAEFKGFPNDPIALQANPPRKDILVGCSPMIFTIEETYMAYDMTARDVQLWCVFPTTTRPFCIRNRGVGFDASPIWDEFDQVVQPQATVPSDSLASRFQCSAYCMLDECVERLENWAAHRLVGSKGS